MQLVTAHREGGYRGGWRPSRSLPRWHLDAFGAEAAKEGGGWWAEPSEVDTKGGWHVDFGNGHREVSTDSGEFDLAAYVEAPWLIVLVCLTAVEEEGGPTAPLPGSHLQMARALAALRPAPQPPSEPRLTVPNMFGLCAALAAARGCSAPVRATAAPATFAAAAARPRATVSRAGAARAVLNVPHPFPSARVAKASLLGGHPVRRALGARRLIPRAVLALPLSASRSSRARLSRAAARRGGSAGGGRARRRGCPLAAFDAAAAASLPRCGHIFSAREYGRE